MKKFFVGSSAVYMILSSIAMLSLFVFILLHPPNKDHLSVHSKILSGTLFVVFQFWSLSAGVGLFLRKTWARFSALLISLLVVLMGAAMILTISLKPVPVNFEKIKIMAIGFGIIFLILIPVLFLFLFNSRGIKGFFVPKDGGKKMIQRPFGITALALFQLISGAVGLFNVFSSYAVPEIIGPWVIEGVGAKVYSMILSILIIFIGVGLLRLNANAWKAAISLQGFLIATGTINILTASEQTLTLLSKGNSNPGAYQLNFLQYRSILAVGVLISILLMVYLISRKKFFLKRAI